LALAALYAPAISLIADGCVKGWTHLAALLKNLGRAIASHDLAALLAYIRDELGSDLLFTGLMASLIFYMAISLAVLSLARFRGGKQWRGLIGWQPWAIWKAGGAFWYIAAAGLASGLAADVAVAYFYPPSKDWFTVPKDNFASSVLLFILAVIFAPFAEELLFRGWIYTSLRARIGLWAALIISSAVFAGLHYEETHIYALAVFPVGLALGGLREVTGSLKASITFHAFFNALAFGLALLDLG
jgi:membrane protease YdiL (CAAX protease family)